MDSEELIFKIGLSLSYDKIKELSSISSNYRNVFSDEYFWKQKLQHHYSITIFDCKGDFEKIFKFFLDHNGINVKTFIAAVEKRDPSLVKIILDIYSNTLDKLLGDEPQYEKYPDFDIYSSVFHALEKLIGLRNIYHLTSDCEIYDMLDKYEWFQNVIYTSLYPKCIL
jgi:hypothetical protein